MSNENERRQEIGDEEEIREEECRGVDETDEDGESDSSTENEESQIEEMDEDGESDSNTENEEEEASEEEGEESYPCRVSMPNKRTKEDSIDRISALPDCLLIHILNKVMDMKTTVTTSVLSKRWEYLWTQLSSFSFNESKMKINKTAVLVSWVHRALALRTVRYLDDLVISFEYKKCFAFDVNTWVQYAVRNNVKKLELDLNSDVLDFFDMLPQSIYSCSSLTNLSMKRCIVAPLTRVDWKHMTHLTISEVELHEHAIQKVLSGCPVLRFLDLTCCWGFERLEVNSKSLHELAITERDGDDEGYSGTLLEIAAPYLRSLTIESFPMGSKKLRLTNIPSLITADIHFDDIVDSEDITVIEMDDMMRFFEDIKHVEELMFKCLFLEILSKMAENGWQLPKSTRKRLTVECNRTENTISGILVLLESSPNLESLTTECFEKYEESHRTWGSVAKDDLDCDLLRLKTVRFTDCADPHLSGEPLLTMARILFKRATALEEMVVDSEGNLDDFSSSFLEIGQKLHSYPRSSQKAVLDLHQ